MAAEYDDGLESVFIIFKGGDDQWDYPQGKTDSCDWLESFLLRRLFLKLHPLIITFSSSLLLLLEPLLQPSVVGSIQFVLGSFPNGAGPIVSCSFALLHPGGVLATDCGRGVLGKGRLQHFYPLCAPSLSRFRPGDYV